MLYTLSIPIYVVHHYETGPTVSESNEFPVEVRSHITSGNQRVNLVKAELSTARERLNKYLSTSVLLLTRLISCHGVYSRHLEAHVDSISMISMFITLLRSVDLHLLQNRPVNNGAKFFLSPSRFQLKLMYNPAEGWWRKGWYKYRDWEGFCEFVVSIWRY